MSYIDKLKDDVIETAGAYVRKILDEDGTDLRGSNDESERAFAYAVHALDDVLRPDPLDLLRRADELLNEAAEETVDAGFDRRIANLQERIRRVLDHG